MEATPGGASSVPLSPIEESILLMRIVLSSTEKGFAPIPGSNLHSRCQRTLRLALALSKNRAELVENEHNYICTSLNSAKAWFTFCLALISNHQDHAAYLAVQHIVRIAPHSVSALLLAAKVCLQTQTDASEAYKYAVQAAEHADVELDHIATQKDASMWLCMV